MPDTTHESDGDAEKTEWIQLRCSPALKRQAVDRAHERREAMAEYIRALIRADVAESDTVAPSEK